MSLYIVANIDGNVISSTNGIEWSAPFDTGISIGKVAVGPNKIVYAATSGEGGEGGEGVSSGLFYASSWNSTPIQAEGTESYRFNEVRYLGNKFVAVGHTTSSPTTPAFAYSEDGENWTIGDIDPAYIALVGNGNDLEFTDVGYNGVGYFIIGILAGEGGENDKAGGFYTTDLTQGLNESNYVTPENFPTDARQLVFAQYEGGENFGAWSAFADDSKTWWSTFDQDPSQPWNFIPGVDLSETLFDNVGLQNLSIAEATIGTLNHEGSSYVVWMVSTTNGQIIWWPHVPAGPFVSVPNPYTTSIATIENLNPLQITFTSNEETDNNEKITVSNSSGLTDLDGVYFIKEMGSGVYELHETKELNSPIDASGWAGSYVNSSATATLSHGTYIDALGYGDGKFFAGNDDEEVFVCSEFNVGGESIGELVWVEVEDLNDSLVYWNDIEYGDFEGCVTTYTYDLSPDNPETIPNYRYGGEGNMDTAIVVGEDGTRRSIQRTGYFDYLDACGNRKVMSVDDGETVTDAPEIPEAAPNSIGHPTFGQNDNPSVTNQTIPTGNPLMN
jgi:hypothetical protein